MNIEKSLLSICLGTAIIGYGGAYLLSRAESKQVDEKVVELRITLKSDAPDTRKTTKRIQPVGDKAICSGAFIDDNGTILTARHCTEGIVRMDVITNDHSVYVASFVAKSNTQDLALVRIDRTNTPFFRLADKIERGEHVSILGSPMGEMAVLSQGFIAKLVGDFIVVDASVVPGNSGGPVYDDSGRLVGIAVAVFVCDYGMTHLGVVEGPDAVKTFVKLVLGRKHDR